MYSCECAKQVNLLNIAFCKLSRVKKIEHDKHIQRQCIRLSSQSSNYGRKLKLLFFSLLRCCLTCPSSENSRNDKKIASSFCFFFFFFLFFFFVLFFLKLKLMQKIAGRLFSVSLPFLPFTLFIVYTSEFSSS